MGTSFRYIAETALKPSGLGDCQCCERAGVVSYDYRGKIVDPAAAANPKLAEEEPEIHAACADCISGGLVQKDDSAIGELKGIINAFAGDKATATQQYHRIPNIPLMMQHDDWPMCCGDWCEFVGYKQWDWSWGVRESG